MAQLSYTRGSVIPLHLAVECSDVQVLDLLSSPNTVVIRLMRTMILGYDRGGGSTSNTATPDINLNLSGVPPIKGYQNLTERVQKAAWWTLPAYDKTEGGRRELQGEIHLPLNLHTTAHLGLYDYFVRGMLISKPFFIGQTDFGPFLSIRSLYTRPSAPASYHENMAGCKPPRWKFVPCTPTDHVRSPTHRLPTITSLETRRNQTPQCTTRSASVSVCFPCFPLHTAHLIWTFATVYF